VGIKKFENGGQITLQQLSNLTGVHILPTPLVKTVGLLIVSNIFMTIAWYGHLKYKHEPLVWVILISWFVALFEYMFQVPANRVGAQTFSLMQLKIMQECITLIVFTVIAYILFGQTLKWNNLVSYAFIIGAVYFSFAF
jgi:uncharacterized protein (DUF486 family)